MCHPNFDKMLEKYVPSKDLPYIKESVKSIQQKVCGVYFINNFQSKIHLPRKVKDRNNYFYDYFC